MRNSSVAVAPKISFARAVSWTPGNSITIRSAPWRWITASATPNSATRLRKIVKFCSIAKLRDSVNAASERARFKVLSPISDTSSVGCNWRIIRAAFDIWSAFSNVTVVPNLSLFLIAVNWIFSLRNSLRNVSCNCSWRLASAEFMSTSIKKRTPPRKSKPHFIGLAPMLLNQAGVAGARFNAVV